MSATPADFLAGLRARHAANTTLRAAAADKIESLRAEYRDRLSVLEIEHSQADAAFQTTAGILEEAEKALGAPEPRPGPAAPAGSPLAERQAEPAARAKRGEIGALILECLRAVPIAGMTEADIIGAIPQHKPGSIGAALKAAFRKGEVAEKDGRYFAELPEPHAAAAPAAPEPLEPIAQPASPQAAQALGQPDKLTESHIINAIKLGPKDYDALMDRCIGLGASAETAGATLADLVARGVVGQTAAGAYDFAVPVSAAS
jgi:hypothetical protein